MVISGCKLLADSVQINAETEKLAKSDTSQQQNSSLFSLQKFHWQSNLTKTTTFINVSMSQLVTWMKAHVLEKCLPTG